MRRRAPSWRFPCSGSLPRSPWPCWLPARIPSHLPAGCGTAAGPRFRVAGAGGPGSPAALRGHTPDHAGRRDLHCSRRLDGAGQGRADHPHPAGSRFAPGAHHARRAGREDGGGGRLGALPAGGEAPGEAGDAPAPARGLGGAPGRSSTRPRPTRRRWCWRSPPQGDDLDRGHRRRQRGHASRSAPRRSALVVRSLRPQGVRPRVLRREDRPPARRRAHRPPQGLRPEGRWSQLGVPGVGLAFIDGGKVVDEGGLGVRELGKPEKVDANTLFMAASNTKGMTTLLLARLVDAGKLSWDEPVVKVYPAFKLGDPAITPQVLFKHLICACTGLPRQDLEFIFEFARRKARYHLRPAGEGEADQQVRRGVPVQQPDGLGGRLHRRSHLRPEAGAGRGVRPGDAEADLRPAPDALHHLRHGPGAAVQPRQPRTARMPTGRSGSR